MVVGEGEETLKELVQALEAGSSLTGVAGLVFRDGAGQMVHNRPRLIGGLDQPAFPARDYLSIAYKRYHHAVVAASQGLLPPLVVLPDCAVLPTIPGQPIPGPVAPATSPTRWRCWSRSTGCAPSSSWTTSSSQRARGGGACASEELIEEIRRRELSFSFSIQYRVDMGRDESPSRSLKEVGLRTVFIGVESVWRACWSASRGDPQNGHRRRPANRT